MKNRMKSTFIHHLAICVTIVAGMLCLAMDSSTLMALQDHPAKRDIKALSESLRAVEVEVVAALRDGQVWSSQPRREELLQLIALAGELRSSQVIGPMLNHIELSRGGFAISPLDRLYPSVGCVIAIGTPAIESLIDYIKATSNFGPKGEVYVAEDGSLRTRRDKKQVITLCVYALAKIYDHPKGMGKEIARLVLGAELKTTEDIGERESLELAINYLDKLWL